MSWWLPHRDCPSTWPRKARIMKTWNIDAVCEQTKNPTLLNALHACRPDHPWNKTAVRPWYNAYFLARQQPSYRFPAAALDWLQMQAERESRVAQVRHSLGDAAARQELKL